MTILLLLGTLTFAGEAPTARPATVEDAAKVLDLGRFPLLPGVDPSKHRRVARLGYEAKGTVADAFAFQKKTLVGMGWVEQPDGYASDQGASGTFVKDGFRVSVSVFPASQGVSVQLSNHGNIEPKAMPVPAEAKPLYAGPVSSMFVAEKPVAETAAECRKKLVALGWQPYGTAGDTQFFKQNAVRLGVTVSSAPAQGNKTVIDYQSELMSADLPAPADTVRTQYADTTKEVSFDTKSDANSVLGFYRDVLGKAGFKPTTENLIKDRRTESIYFLNPRKDLVALKMYPVDGILRVSLRHQTTEEVAEMMRIAREEEEKKNKPTPAAAKPVVAIAIPAGAKDVKVTASDIKFKLGPGKAKEAVRGMLDTLKKAGWKAEVASVEALAGAASLRKGTGDLTFTYVDTGLEDAEVSISGIGVVLERAK